MIPADTQLFVTFTAGKLLVAASNLLVTVFVARLVGAEGVGQWTLLLAAGAFVHTTLINWTHGGTVRFGREEWLAHGTLRTTVFTRLPLVCAGCALAVATLMLNPFDWLGVAFGVRGSAWWLAAIYAASLWIAAEAQATLQALDRVRVQAIAGPVVALVTICALAVYAASGTARTISAVLVLVSMIAIGVWGSVWVRTLAGARVGWTRPDVASIQRHLLYGGPLLVGFAVGYVSLWGDHLLLRRLASVEEVGYFALAYQVFMTMVAANGTLPTLLLPRLIGSQLASVHAGRTYLTDVVPTLFVLWGLGVIALVAVLPSVLVATSGDTFTRAATTVVVLSVILPSAVISSLYTVLFSLQERLGRVLVYACVMAAVNIAVSLALIPRFGAVGSAIGTIAGFASSQIAYVADQHRHLKVPSRAIVAIWIALVAAGIAQVWVVTLPGRVAWAAGAALLVIWSAKVTSAVSPRVVDRLFAGALAPVAKLIRRTMIATA